ncbi:MAG: FG-GAP repeat protein [Chthoniobacterales bacterium]
MKNIFPSFLGFALLAAILPISELRAASASLRGDPAIPDLQANGSYGSLQEAIAAAREQTEGTPMFSFQAKLISPVGAMNGTFGTTVAISGETAVVGDREEAVGGNTRQGAAYVFVRNGTTWSEQQKLLASDGAMNGLFGSSVAIDGNTLVVGAGGAAYVFVRNGTVWSQQQKLLGPAAATAGFFGGDSVAISGNTVVVSATYEDINGLRDQGAAYVFVRSGTTWTEQQKLTAADGGSDDEFGFSVAVQGDNVIVGAHFETLGTFFGDGAAYVFVRNGNTWSQQQKLIAADAISNAEFGGSVAISGETVMIGAPFDRSSRGAAYIFVRSGTTWSEQQKLTASNAATGNLFGFGVAINGNTALAGAPNSSGTAGSTYVFSRAGATWTQQQQVFASDPMTNAGFGASTAISGNTAFIGANGVSGNTQGAAYIFVTPQLPNTLAGTNVTVSSPAGNASVTFPTVSVAGFTGFAPLNPPTSAGTPPAGYTLSGGGPAYDITTTATYTGPVTVCFTVSGITSAAQFARVRILHREGGQLVDRTILAPDSPAPDFATRRVCARFDTLSPFVIALAPGAAEPTKQFLNISTRARVLTGDNVMICGFIITGNAPKKVILRALGPSLGSVAGRLSDPTLELVGSNGQSVELNDNWMESPMANEIMNILPLTNQLESAILRTLNPSAYTAIVRGKNRVTCVGLVELYDLAQPAASKLVNISTRASVETGDNVLIGGFIVGGNGTANTRVFVRGLGPSLGTAGVSGALADPILQLVDGNGMTVRSNDNWTESQMMEIQETTIPPNNPLESALIATLGGENYTAVLRGKNDTTGVGPWRGAGNFFPVPRPTGIGWQDVRAQAGQLVFDPLVARGAPGFCATSPLR